MIFSRKIADLRRDGTLWWARPDSKTQVTAEYKFETSGSTRGEGACVPLRVHTVVVSCQHSEKVTLEALRKDIMERVVMTTIPKMYRDADTKYHINPCGNFVIGGPMGDAGLTGRKIIVDTYGGWGAHGGGAFSGKDYTKVNRKFFNVIISLPSRWTGVPPTQPDGWPSPWCGPGWSGGAWCRSPTLSGWPSRSPSPCSTTGPESRPPPSSPRLSRRISIFGPAESSRISS